MSGCGTSSTQTATTAGATAATSGVPRLESVASDFDTPTQVIGFPGEPGHLWVLEQAGTIRSVRDGVVDRTPVADLRASTKSGGERGLLSLAFHPNFPAPDLVYIHRSDSDGNTLVTEHRVDAGRIGAEPTRTLLQVDQPFSNHNGGSLAFGPDGLLYLGLGDGGSGGDPQGNGQNLDTKLGKLLRVDLNAPSSWEVAAYGLRNPWRFSFDSQTGSAWIGDVGQNAWEEVDVFPKDSPQLNYGWSVREGRHDFAGGGNRSLTEGGVLTEPVAEYSHDEGCSITGGVVVRDPALRTLNGRYLYADYCSGTFWSIPADTDGSAKPRKEPFSAKSPVSIDATPDGTVYVTSQSGAILRLTAGT